MGRTGVIRIGNCVGLAALLILIVIGNIMPPELLELRRSTAWLQDEPWRLWTAQFCHWSPAHLAGNLAALVLITAIGGTAAVRWLALLPMLAPLLSFFILFSAPTLERYRGLSGLVSVLVVPAAIHGGCTGRVLAALWCGKVILDAWSGGQSPLLPSGIVTTWQAHLGGLVLGTGTAILLHTSFHRKPT